MTGTKQTTQTVRNAALAGPLANLALACLKWTAGAFCKSRTLQADGFHSLEDLLADAVVLIALFLPHWRSTEKQQSGQRRIESMLSLAMSTFLLVEAAQMLHSSAQQLYFLFSEKQLLLLDNSSATAGTFANTCAVAVAVVAIAVKEQLYQTSKASSASLHSELTAVQPSRQLARAVHPYWRPALFIIGSMLSRV